VISTRFPQDAPRLRSFKKSLGGDRAMSQSQGASGVAFLDKKPVSLHQIPCYNFPNFCVPDATFS
jgi:hypothetical protein